jgi:hypothetical protein
MIHACGCARRRPSLAACSTTDPIEYAIPCTMIVTSMPRRTIERIESWMARPSVTLPPALLM